MTKTTRLAGKFLAKVEDRFAEITRPSATAPGRGERYASAHEAYAVLLEEVDELKEEIWKKRTQRDKRQMIEECLDIAAVACKFAAQLAGELDRASLDDESPSPCGCLASGFYRAEKCGAKRAKVEGLPLAVEGVPVRCRCECHVEEGES